jgi:hypothetical protein
MLLARREQWLTPTLEEFRGKGFRCEGMGCDAGAPEQIELVIDINLTGTFFSARRWGAK